MRLCELNSAASQAELRHVREKLQIELLRAAILRIKLFSEFYLNDYTGSYITVLIEERNSVTTVTERAENELNTDESADRRDDTLLQGTATITTAARDAEGGE
ncbi:hypothetical protein BDFG_07443, partial [Blastomyces dermatitidis ATCC 26199]